MRAPSLLAVVYFTLLAITLVALPEGAVRAQAAAEVGLEKQIQTALAEAGFEPGVADGKLGPTTRRAIQAWQRAKGYAATGALTIGQVEALLGGARSLAAYNTPGAQGLTLEQDAVYTVQAPTTDVTDSERLTVVAWVDHADSVYAVGEWVRLFVQANKDAYLTVLNVGASGQTTVLFPNAHQTEVRVSANQIVEVPDPSSGASLTVSGPTGWELIKVIGSTKPTSLFSARTAPAAGLFTTLKSNSRSVARDLQMTMQTQADQEWDDYNKIIQNHRPPHVCGDPAHAGSGRDRLAHPTVRPSNRRQQVSVPDGRTGVALRQDYNALLPDSRQYRINGAGTGSAAKRCATAESDPRRANRGLSGRRIESSAHPDGPSGDGDGGSGMQLRQPAGVPGGAVVRPERLCPGGTRGRSVTRAGGGEEGAGLEPVGRASHGWLRRHTMKREAKVQSRTSLSAAFWARPPPMDAQAHPCSGLRPRNLSSAFATPCNSRENTTAPWFGYSFVPGDLHPLPSASSPSAPDFGTSHQRLIS